jgi:hypothetical protein
MGLSGHVSGGPFMACVKVDNCCDPFFAGTLTCAKSLEMMLRATLPPYTCDSQQQIIHFYFGEDN